MAVTSAQMTLKDGALSRLRQYTLPVAKSSLDAHALSTSTQSLVVTVLSPSANAPLSPHPPTVPIQGPGGLSASRLTSQGPPNTSDQMTKLTNASTMVSSASDEVF